MTQHKTGAIASLKTFGVRVQRIASKLCEIELLCLGTALLPALMASVGFFFGKMVSPNYFYCAICALLAAAFVGNWRRGIVYLIILLSCGIMTAFTFTYAGIDAQTCHFPMQYLLRHGWNPVFDSTIEKFTALAGDAYVSKFHILFMPKFVALSGAIVASALGLFAGDSFVGYLLVLSLFISSVKFAKQYWSATTIWSIIFAASITLSTKITSLLAGEVDYLPYATFCISSMMLILYLRDKHLEHLLTFAISTIICLATKYTGFAGSFLLIASMLPLLYRRIAFRRCLLLIVLLFAIIGATPFLTAWVQYGSPFYPASTFNPHIEIINITSDFTGNDDALSMGYFSRICYAWVSPKLTVATIRILRGNPSFNPEFTVYGGVAGLGLWFNALLFFSVILLALSRKNIITLLCIIIFISSNLAPLKYIGYARYFPQIWAIFPLSVLNYLYASKIAVNENMWFRLVNRYAVYALGCALVGWSILSFLRSTSYACRMMVQERFRQNAIANFSPDKPVRVEGGIYSYRLTNVVRFKQAGIRLVKSEDGEVDTVIQKDIALPCYDTHPEIYEDLERRFPLCNSPKAIFCDFKWFDVPQNMPHILWDSDNN